MCDCDENDFTDIPVGPTGATGPTGPAPDLIGVSTSTVLTDTGTRTFSGLSTDLPYSVGQRLRASNDDASKILEGEVDSFAAGVLTLNVDYVEGSGSDSSWTINITGTRGTAGATGSAGGTGADGAAGKNAYGVTSAIATSLGANLYTVPLANTYWGVVGQIIYIGTAGYYQITAISAGVSFTVLDLLYTGNVPANMVAGSGLGVSPGGRIGGTGLTGATGGVGATGATGATGPAASFTKVSIASTSITASTDIGLIATCATSGTLYVNGQFEVESTDALLLTVTLLINGVAQAVDNTAVATGPPPVTAKSTINLPYVNYFAVVAGDEIEFRITANSYVLSTDMTGRFVYAIM